MSLRVRPYDKTIKRNINWSIHIETENVFRSWRHIRNMRKVLLRMFDSLFYSTISIILEGNGSVSFLPFWCYCRHDRLLWSMKKHYFFAFLPSIYVSFEYVQHVLYPEWFNRQGPCVQIGVIESIITLGICSFGYAVRRDGSSYQSIRIIGTCGGDFEVNLRCCGCL